MKTLVLKPFCIEGIEELLAMVEDRFGVEITETDLIGIGNLDELCDCIIGKIPLDNTTSSTVGYLLGLFNKCIGGAGLPYTQPLSLTTPLKEVFPLKGRRRAVRKLEEDCGLALNLFLPRSWLLSALFVVSLLFFILIFYDWRVGCAGLIASQSAIFLLYRFSTDMRFDTFGHLIYHLIAHNALALQLGITEINKAELSLALKKWFASNI